MRLRETLLLLVLCFFQSLSLSAQQSTLTIQLSEDGQRVPVNVAPGETRIRLCGLKAGTSYQVVATGLYMGEAAEFRLKMADADQETLASGLTPSSRPQQRQFKASGSCMEILLNTENAGPASEVPLFISIARMADTGEKDWKDQFLQETAKLTVTQGNTPDYLVTNVLIGGNCFDVKNISGQGAANGRGTFSNGTSSIDIANGVVLCTGPVSSLPGPNNLTNANGGFTTNSPDDPNLATLTTGNQFDVSTIEFDFTPTADMVQFDFVFGSEEYCEFVNTQYNDVFGFFISGPGITGVKNLAVLPNSNTPITVNNVNHNLNKNYYVNNNTYFPCETQPIFNSADIQLDGYTKVLTATANLQSCKTYHIKLAIADIGDANYTSAVFLRANSFDAGGDVKASPAYPSTAANYSVEGCGTGAIRFYRGSGDASLPLNVAYTVAGSSTAVSGVDYQPLPSSVTIPAGQTEILVPVIAFKDALTEGPETITLLLDNPCSCLQQDVTFVIQDQQPLAVTMNGQLGCTSTATLTPVLQSGGLPPLTYQWNTGQVTPNLQLNTPGTDVYTVTVTDVCGLSAQASATATVDQTPTAILDGTLAFCPGGSGDLSIDFTGFGPWVLGYTANGLPQTQTFTSNPGLINVSAPGTYSLTSVSSLAGCPGLAGGSVTAQEVQVSVSLQSQNPACYGGVGSLQAQVLGNFPPYNYLWNDGSTSNGLSGLPVGSYTVTVSTPQGCTAVSSSTLTQPAQLTAEISRWNDIDCYTPQCTIELTAAGGTPGYLYLWNTGAAQQNPVFTSGGGYTVTITDANHCSAVAAVTVAQNTTPPLAAIAATDEITCNTPEVYLSAGGSSSGADFTYSWNTNTGHFVSTPTGIKPLVDASGVYVLVVTNTKNGCTSSAQATVLENTNYPTALDYELIQPGCKNNPGAIHVQSVTGGEEPYLFSINGGMTFMSATAFTALGPGQYDLVVQDINGCEFSQQVELKQPVEPSVEISPEVKLAFGETALLTALINVPLSELDSIIWSPTLGLTETGRPDMVQARPFKSTEYYVTVISKNGCSDRANVIVRVGEPNIYAPNAISPGNQDGENDVFTLFTSDVAVSLIRHMQVYDRWGNQVYARNDFSPNDDRNGGWDGKYHGKMLEPGVFTWWADVELVSGDTILLKDDVTIVK